MRQKYEQLITDLVHQRDTTRHLTEKKVSSIEDFSWLYHMRYYWNTKEKEAIKKVRILMANAFFYYGFEYLGVGEKLVQTPLTDRCYLTLTQALISDLEEIHSALLVQEKLNLLKLSDVKLEDLFLYSTEMKHLMETQWQEFSLDCAKLELGDA